MRKGRGLPALAAREGSSVHQRAAKTRGCSTAIHAAGTWGLLEASPAIGERPGAGSIHNKREGWGPPIEALVEARAITKSRAKVRPALETWCTYGVRMGFGRMRLSLYYSWRSIPNYADIERPLAQREKPNQETGHDAKSLLVVVN